MVEDPSLVEYICRTPHEKLKKAFYARQKGFLARSMMSHGLVARSAAFARLHVPACPAHSLAFCLSDNQYVFMLPEMLANQIAAGGFMD